MNAQGTIVACMAVSAAVVTGNQVVQGQAPAFRQLAGAAFVAFGLAAGATIAPGPTTALAVLIATSSVLVYGEPILNALSTQ